MVDESLMIKIGILAYYHGLIKQDKIIKLCHNKKNTTGLESNLTIMQEVTVTVMVGVTTVAVLGTIMVVGMALLNHRTIL
jgi:hypothetical protein